MLETGVEHRVDVVCLQEPLRERERGGIGISHSAYEIRKKKKNYFFFFQKKCLHGDTERERLGG